MSFQKCPICEGTGNDPYITIGSQLEYPCPTCKGARIIDDVTGFPPITQKQHNIFESVISTIDPIIPNQNTNSNNSTQTPTQDVSHIQSRGS